MEIDYDELRRIYRLEKNTSRMVDVDEDFFPSLAEFMKQEKKDYLKSLEDPSSSKAVSYSNLQKLLLELFELREKKILNRAMLVSRTGDDLSVRLSKEEQKTFDRLLTVLKDHKNSLNEILPENGSAKKEDKDLNKIRVRILKEVPSFVGSNMQEYGPFLEGKQIELPEKTATLLIKRGLAEKND